MIFCSYPEYRVSPDSGVLDHLEHDGLYLASIVGRKDGETLQATQLRGWSA